MRLDQGQIIDAVNKHLDVRHFPRHLRLGRQGVCNGLSNLYAVAVLEHREKEFDDMLRLLACGRTHSDTISESQVYHFIAQVMIAQSPWQFDRRFWQGNAFELLQTVENKVHSTFKFALATTDKNWVEIFDSIDLKENEVMLLVGSENHIVTVRKCNGMYCVYDPNSSVGELQFETTTALVNELHQHVFSKSLLGNLGLGMNILDASGADSPGGTSRSAAALYKKYYNPGTDKIWLSRLTHLWAMAQDVALFQYDRLIQSTIKLLFADHDRVIEYWQAAMAYLKDEDAINHLIERRNGNKSGYLAAGLIAAGANNTVALKLLVEKCDLASNGKLLVYIALSTGRAEAFDVLRPYLKQIFSSPKDDTMILLEAAAFGGNPRLLKTLIDMHADRPKDENYRQCIKDAVKSAITGGSFECTKLMIHHYEALNGPESKIDEATTLEFLKHAIAKNQNDVVRDLISIYPKLSENALKNLYIDPFMADRTDIEVLETLKEAGVTFSQGAATIMEAKIKKAEYDVYTTFELWLYTLNEHLSYAANRGAAVTQHFKQQIKSVLQAPDTKTENDSVEPQKNHKP